MTQARNGEKEVINHKNTGKRSREYKCRLSRPGGFYHRNTQEKKSNGGGVTPKICNQMLQKGAE